MKKIIFIIIILLLCNFVMGANEMNILNYEDTPIYFKCHDLLMTANNYLKENKVKEAYKTYEKIASNKSYPQTYRTDAEYRLAILSGNQNPYSSKSNLEPIKTEKDFYVSQKGSDNNQGVKESPFLTIAKAIDAVNNCEEKGPFGIVILEDKYLISQSVNLDTLSKPAVIKSLNRTVITGGYAIEGFKPISDPEAIKKIPPEAQNKVYEADLFGLGITNLPELQIRGFAQKFNPNIEVFKDGKICVLARYPNQGYMDIDKLVSPGNIKENIPSIFTYKDNRLDRWAGEKDLWLKGYFRYRWADRTIKVTEVNPKTKEIIMNPGYQYTNEGPMDNSQGILYYGFNLLQELDCDGEYYIDREKGKLYIYSEDDINNHKIELSIFGKPFFIGDNVKNVSFENLDFDLSQDRLLSFEKADNILLYNCKISRFGNDPISVSDINNSTVYGCEFFNLSKGAIYVTGGDREKLIHSNTIIENCKFHNIGNVDKTGVLAIGALGCGFTIKYNQFSDTPAGVLYLGTSESLVEFNIFNDCVNEADDQGVIDSFANPTFRGNIIRFNHFIDCGVKNDCGDAAIRLDDAVSGFYIFGNIIERSATGGFGAVQINCGRDTLIDNNIIIDCSYAFSGGYYFGNPDWEPVYKPDKKNDLYYYNDLYFDKYPEMKNDYRPDGNNYMFRNIIINCSSKYPKMFNMDEWGFNPYYVNREPLGIANPEIKGNDIVTKDYKVDQRVAEEIGFSQLPFEEIGNY